MILRVALDVPLAAAIHTNSPAPEETLFDYASDEPALPGQRVLVPWGRQVVIGIVFEVTPTASIDAERIKPVQAVLEDIAPMPASWLEQCRFAARYYHRAIGEVALSAVPKALRTTNTYRPDDEAGGRIRSRAVERLARKALSREPAGPRSSTPELSAEQRAASDSIVAALDSGTFSVQLLFGVTGSGKTEVYLQAVARCIAQGRQALLLVPEINLTPQLEAIVRSRFPGVVIATLHSGLAEGERALNWLAAHRGEADIVLGTRLAVMASLPRPGVIIVDEEHDPSFKQQEGVRYSARDLAIKLAHDAKVPVVLGSATPSLESWWHAKEGRYRLLVMTQRSPSANRLPDIELIPMRHGGAQGGLSPQLARALGDALEGGEQVLVFLNRRGYAPVLACPACGWISDCPRCSAHAVYHKSDQRMHCHHCGWHARVARCCPECGNLDIAPLGRGTQRIEETLAERFPGARIARIDRDSTQQKGAAAKLLSEVHEGRVNLLVGTQMIAKGHDFRNLTLVAVIDPDSSLYSQDFRAQERLFSNLMQVAGRAGRGQKPGRVLIQTRYPEHPLFAALCAHDFARFANAQLAERREASLPPFSYQALLRAEGRTLEAALAFLNRVRDAAQALPESGGVVFYDAVPMTLMRRAGIERAQLLLEAPQRARLQRLLDAWLAILSEEGRRLNWHLEVDPQDI